jgi:hypothetical protein
VSAGSTMSEAEPDAQPPARNRDPRRRAALIATAVTVPVIVVVAFLLGNLSGSGSSSPKAAPSSGPLPAVTVAAPPSSAAAQAPCTSILEALPTQLDNLDARQVVSDPSSPFVVGWGNPAVVLRCGVARPADLHPDSTTVFQGISSTSSSAPVYFDVTSKGDDNVYTTVDRAVYIEISVPAADASGPMPALAGIIGSTLPAVCAGGQVVTGSPVPADQLCAERK